METSSTLTILNNRNNGRKTRGINEVVLEDIGLELPCYRPRQGTECIVQRGIPVIDLTVDTPTHREYEAVEGSRTYDIRDNMGSNVRNKRRFEGVEVIDVDNLAESQSSRGEIEVYERYPFEGINLEEILVLNGSISENNRNCHIGSFGPTRRITRQTANQMRLWENRIFERNDSFLQALINHMTPSNRRRGNGSVRYSRTYPYYISSRQNISTTTTPIEYSIFTEQSNINRFSKKDALITQRPFKEAPSAMKGFTRSLNKSQKLVCPNCIDELGVSDDFIKRSIWMGKCGHIYCGSCAKIFKSMKSKGPQSVICPVKHCNKVISGNHNLREIYV
ncbi:hypothetical protein T552_00911 [Pneumocystis carinii B80]|uniref:RING-type domain-containing protein n=1 Tax=Pneumocystis carinii (strain B80) TaxID=1408658 RepID=A0A0W4ZMV1_PNEC8|nr:hypothetical protein T552_00911 [Pneumocystis carinii B80]KTW29703.1 hypothetical protein T552_00911 [Pneumocystis carinii B80]